MSRGKASDDDGASKPTKATGRFRKIEVRTWGDEKFRALTPIPACGQGLWLYLMTGPHTGPIPGLFRAGRAGMAEELGWEPEDFDKALNEVLAQGMAKADFKARVMWLPKAIVHNRPESPNVVKNWAVEFDLIPECGLKREAFETLKASIHAIGEAFGKAFDEAFAKPPQGLPKGIGESGAGAGAGAIGSEANASARLTAEQAEAMTKEELWSAGKSLLEAAKVPKAQCGSFIGGLVQQHGGEIVLQVVRAAVVEVPADPRAWMTAACQQKAGTRRPKSNGTHAGFDGKDYREGVTADGSLV